MAEKRKRGRPKKVVAAKEVAESIMTQPQPPAKGRSVCILGYAEESRDLVFNLGADVQIWGINAAHFFIHATDSTGSLTGRTKAVATDWFQVHPRDWASQKGEVTGFYGRPKEHMDFLKKFNGNVWLQAADPEIPNSKTLPVTDIVVASGRQYFTSTFAYQLGLLWYQHTQQNNPVERLYVYGVNLSSIDEYIHQKPCVEYWLGRLQEAGVKINVPTASALLKGKLYGIGGSSDDLSDHAFERLQYWKGKYIEAWANVNTGSSMKVDTEFWTKALSKVAEKYPEQFNDEIRGIIQATISERVATLNQLIDRSGAEVNGALGMVKDNQHWLSLTGGIDHRAPTLPELRIPSAQLSEAFELPKATSI